MSTTAKTERRAPTERTEDGFVRVRGARECGATGVNHDLRARAW